jgi:hypothetical protein
MPCMQWQLQKMNVALYRKDGTCFSFGMHAGCALGMN